MAFTTNPYCALNDVKTALNVSLTDTTKDAFIEQLITQAQSYIDTEIGYPFQTDGTSQSPASRFYNGTNMDQLYIDDCVSVSQVLETNYSLYLGTNGVWVQNNIGTTDITADIVLGPENILSYGKSGYLLARLSGLPFIRGKRNYQVFGVFGQSSIPLQIARACIRLTIHWYKMRDTNYADVISAQGGVHQRFAKHCPDDVCEILEDFKRRLFLVG